MLCRLLTLLIVCGVLCFLPSAKAADDPLILRFDMKLSDPKTIIEIEVEKGKYQKYSSKDTVKIIKVLEKDEHELDALIVRDQAVERVSFKLKKKKDADTKKP